MEELIDVYTENKELTGQVVKRGSFLQPGQFMLYTLAIIENGQGSILITQRSQDKHWAAGWWEVTGGGVSAGQGSQESMVREIAEEVGLNATGKVGEPIYSYMNIDAEHGDNYIVDIYHVRMDFNASDVTLQDSEAVDFKLVSWKDIESLNEQGIFLHFKRLQQALQAEGVL